MASYRSAKDTPKPTSSNLWWLSYADDNDGGFRGAVITEAPDFLSACLKANLLGLSPGGQVLGDEVPLENVPEILKEDIDRLLTKADTEKYT